MALGLIFGGCIILIYQKMKLQSKNYEILNKQKLRKKIYIYLPLTCFLFRNSLTTIYLRTIISSSSGMSCINIKKECLTLSCLCRSQLGLILKVGLTLKSSSKITLGLILRVDLIIGETRYITSPATLRCRKNQSFLNFCWTKLLQVIGYIRK